MPSKPEIVPATTARKLSNVPRNSRKPAASRLIVVLGMHRSGTSVVTRSVKALGADLGDNLMKPVANNNEKGFWEDLDFNQLNERILAKAGSAWHYLHPIDTAMFGKSAYASERIEAAALLKQKTQNVPIFAVKDPRTAVLLPFWQCVMDDLDLEPSYLITLRNPLETVESLRKRDGFDRQKSLVLWLKHVYAAIKGTEGARRVFVSYEQFLDNPESELERLAEGLELIFPPSGNPALKEFLVDFLDASLRHNRISDKELRRDETIPAPIPKLFDLAHEWCRISPNADSVFPDELSREIEAYFESRGDFLEYSDRVETTLAAVRKQAKESAANAKDLETKLEELKTESSRVIADWELKYSQQRNELEGQAAELVSKLGAAEAENLTVTSQLEQLQASLRDAEENALGMQAQLSELKTAFAEARAAHTRLSDEKSALHGELTDAQSLIDRLRNDLTKAAAQFGQAETRRAQTEHELQSLRQSAERFRKERDAVQATLDAENLPELKARLADSTARVGRLNDSAAAYEATISELRKELRLQRAALLELRNSTSWRLTRPLRGMKLLLARTRNSVRRLGSENDR